MTRTPTALIIGGGIAGPTAAMALLKAGVESVVYERHSVGADGFGSFLTVASNGVDALRVIDADEPAVAAGFATPYITLRNGKGKRLGQTRTGHPLADGTTSQTIKRSELYRVLREQAIARGIRFEHGKRLVRAQETAQGVWAEFQDGTEAVADYLIGCDGIQSTARRLIDPAAPAPTYSGLLTAGGYVRGVDVPAASGSYEMIFGRHGFFGYAAAPDGEVFWFANIPEPVEPERGKLLHGEDLRQSLLDLFADDAGPATALIRATPEVGQSWPIHSLPHLPSWHKGPMIVIGDAAHAPTPTSGQGASLAIEDAVVLAKLIRDSADHREAFARFEARRRPRVERIIKWAARINSSKAAGPIGSIIRDAMLPPVLRMTANSKANRETYGYHIAWDATEPVKGSSRSHLGR